MSMHVTEKRAHGLRLTHAVADYPDHGVHRGTSDDDVVRLHFSLRGQYRARYPSMGRRFERLGPHCSLFYARPFELEFTNQTPSIETFGVQFPIERFVRYTAGIDPRVARFCEQVAAGQSGFLLEPSAALTPALEPVIRCMLDARYQGALEDLYLLSRSLELLVQVLAGQRPATHAPIGKRERDRLFAARDFIDARLGDPPAVAHIARAVGLNDYKLKRGFKQLFGTSVFAYLTTQRLELARRMLLDTDTSAAEVALALGYASPQHFSQAFKKRYGVAPKSMRKSP